MTSPAPAAPLLDPEDPTPCRSCQRVLPLRVFLQSGGKKIAPSCLSCRTSYVDAVRWVDLSAYTPKLCGGCDQFAPWPTFSIYSATEPGAPPADPVVRDRCAACRRKSAPRRRCAKAPRESIEDRVIRALKTAGKPVERKALRSLVRCRTGALGPALRALLAAGCVRTTGAGKRNDPILYGPPPTSPEAPPSP